MTIKELYLWVKKNGCEDYEILLSEPENDPSVLEEDDILKIDDCEDIIDPEDMPKNAIVLDCWKY